MDAISGALDCDVEWCPLTNTMPVLRHRLLDEPGTADFLAAWVAVPTLSVRPSRQRYTALGATADGMRLIRFDSLDSDFTADLTFDRDGLVVTYPGLARRLS
jgi:hypothetical protein